MSTLARSLPRFLLFAQLLVAPACHDFALAPRPQGPPAPTITDVEPSLFFAGQPVTLTGTGLDGRGGEVPQVTLDNVVVVPLGAVADQGGGVQAIQVTAPRDLRIGVDLEWRVRTSVSETTAAKPSQYLGLGHLDASARLGASAAGVNLTGLSAGGYTAMIVEEYYRRLIVVDLYSIPEPSQVVTLELPFAAAGSAPVWTMPTLEDVAVHPAGDRALLSYGVLDANGLPEAIGLAALTACEDGRWRVTRHFQLGAGQGRLVRMVYSATTDTFLVARGMGVEGLLSVKASDLPQTCPDDTKTVADVDLGVAPPPDPDWQPDLVTQPSAGHVEVNPIPGMAVSDDGRWLATAREFDNLSTLDVYDLAGTVPTRSRHVEADGNNSEFADVIPFGASGDQVRLAALDDFNWELLVEESPGDGFAGAVPVDPEALYLYASGQPDQILVAGPLGIARVDLDLETRIGSVVTPGEVVRLSPYPDYPGFALALPDTLSARQDELLVIDLDAGYVTTEVPLSYRLRAAVYSDLMDTFVAVPVMDFGESPGGSSGMNYASYIYPLRQAGQTATSVTGAAATRDFFALSGELRLGVGDAAPVVMFTRNSAQGGEGLQSTYKSGSPGPYLGLAPYATGVIGLKATGFERVATGSDCLGSPTAEGPELALPASCTVAWPAQLALPAGTHEFAVAESAGQLIVPQQAASGSNTVLAARVALDGTLVSQLQVAGTWTGRGVSTCRDGSVVALVAGDDQDLRTAFYTVGDQAVAQVMDFFATEAGAAAVSPDCTTIYLGNCNGRIWAVTLPPAGKPIDPNRDLRLVANAGTDTDGFTMLGANPDGATLAGVLNSQTAADEIVVFH